MEIREYSYTKMCEIKDMKYYVDREAFSKKINGKNERFYALKKINNTKSVTINDEHSIEYTDSIK